MKLVLDSSVAFKWEIVEADADKARRNRDDFRNGIVDLLAPDFFPVEAMHAITRAERQGRITPAEGAASLAAFLRGQWRHLEALLRHRQAADRIRVQGGQRRHLPRAQTGEEVMPLGWVDGSDCPQATARSVEK